MISIKDYFSSSKKGWNKCIDIEVPIRILLEMKDKEVQDWAIISTTKEDDTIAHLIANELEDKGIDIILKLIQKLDNDKYEKLIEGT